MTEKQIIVEEVRTIVCSLCGGPIMESVARLRAVLQEFVDRERAIRDSITKGGQHVGTSPTINPSTLKRLEEMLRDTND